MEYVVKIFVVHQAQKWSEKPQDWRALAHLAV